MVDVGDCSVGVNLGDLGNAFDNGLLHCSGIVEFV